VEYFYKDKNTPDKLSSWCKECRKEYQRNYKQEHKEYCNIQDMEYYNNNKDRYYINSKRYKEEHHEEVTAKEQIWADNNRDKMNGYVRDRNQHKEHKISEKERLDCLAYFNNSCAYCNISETKHKKLYNERLHKEHAYNNGSNNVTNCIPGCKSCNGKKRGKDFNEWYIPYNPRFEEGFYKQENYDKIVKWLEEDCFQYLDPKHKD